MKYIVVKKQVSEFLAKEFPIIFPQELVHSEVFENIKKLIGDNVDVTAAGEVSLFDGVTCSGHSETLEIGSRGEEDERLFRTYDYFHGYSDN